MKLINFEGIATTGKSTVETELEKICEREGYSFKLYHEDDTVIPLMGEKTVSSSVAHLKKIIEQIKMDTTDVVVLDRFFLTHLKRTKGGLDEYAHFLEQFTALHPTIIFLHIAEGAIKPRLEDAVARRHQRFADFINERGGVDTNVTKYIEEQRYLLNLLPTIGIPFTTFETSDMQFTKIAQDIFDRYIKQ